MASASRAREVLAREQDLGRVRVRDLARQAHRRAAHRVERPARLRDAEARALAGHADLHRLQDLGAAGDRDALDRGDDRLASAGSGGTAPCRRCRGRPPCAPARRSRDRRRRASPDIARRSAPEQKLPPAPVTMMQRIVRVARRLLVGVVHADQHRARERVHALGAVHGDRQQMAVALDDRIGHAQLRYEGDVPFR